MNKFPQEFRSFYNKEENAYSTLNLIGDLCDEIAKLVPKTQLYGGTLSYSKVSKFLGQGKLFLKHIKSRITNLNDPGYNPDYKFSIERLLSFKVSLKADFGDSAIKCLNLIKKYEDKNDNLKDSINQQWHLNNPKLRVNFFNKIDNKEKAYWFGFLCADGSLDYTINKKNKKLRYQIRIELSVYDKDQLKRFCRTIGLDLNKIKEREKEIMYKGECKKYHMAYIQFTCKPMAEDLLNHNFASSKAERKNMPKLGDRDLMLAWLLGYYDGDGLQGRTDILSANRDFLENIRKFFDIQFGVRKDHEDNNVWSLTLGASLFNEMIMNYKYSLERKRKSFDENPRSGVIDQLRTLISKELLQELIYQYPVYKLAEMYKVYKGTFSKFIKEMGVIIPDRGYWLKKK